MNSTETTMVLSVLQAAYPAFYRDFSVDEMRRVVALWTDMFAADNFRTVMVAVQALISTKTEGIPPTIGAVKEQLRKITAQNEMSEQEAWALVSKACQNGYYHSVEEFEKLPEVVQRSIGGPEQLKAWAQMDAATVESVVASNFMRTFRVKQTQQKELDMMPADVKQYMSAVAEKMALENPDRKQLDKPKQAALEPPKLEKLGIPNLEKVLPKPDIPSPAAYKPPSGEEWAKRREEALAKLNVARGANGS